MRRAASGSVVKKKKSLNKHTQGSVLGLKVVCWGDWTDRVPAMFAVGCYKEKIDCFTIPRPKTRRRRGKKNKGEMAETGKTRETAPAFTGRAGSPPTSAASALGRALPAACRRRCAVGRRALRTTAGQERGIRITNNCHQHWSPQGIGGPRQRPRVARTHHVGT